MKSEKTIKFGRLIILLVILLINISCKKSPTEPVESTPPGRRDYVWTADTIFVPSSRISHMWGPSPTDIWAISPPYDYDSAIFHYDGSKWKVVKTNVPINAETIYGFGANDIWIGTSDGFLIHYDGSTWHRNTSVQTYDGKYISWECIWGESANDVYAVGAYLDSNKLFNNGVIAHYNGIAWQFLSGINKPNTSGQIYKSPNDGSYYLSATRWGGTLVDSTYILKFDGKSLKTIYSGTYGTSKYCALAMLGNDLYYIIGRNLCTYDGNNFNAFMTFENADLSVYFKLCKWQGLQL